jgi:hypothetical protein
MWRKGWFPGVASTWWAMLSGKSLRQFASTLTNIEKRVVSRDGQYLVGNAFRRSSKTVCLYPDQCGEETGFQGWPVPGGQCSQVSSSQTVCNYPGQCGEKAGFQGWPVSGGQRTQVSSSQTACLYPDKCGEKAGFQGWPVPGGQCSQVRSLRQVTSTLTNVKKSLVSRGGQYLVGNALR